MGPASVSVPPTSHALCKNKEYYLVKYRDGLIKTQTLACSLIYYPTLIFFREAFKKNCESLDIVQTSQTSPTIRGVRGLHEQACALVHIERIAALVLFFCLVITFFSINN